MGTFKAIVVDKAEGGQTVALSDFDDGNLMDGDVTVGVEYSTVKYKDGLAVTGKAPVVRRFPMIAGVDFAGTVESSSHPKWKPGDKVILNGWGLGETHLGAYAQKARVKGDWLVALQKSMSARDAMAIGTAGYTAMLSVMALEHAGLGPARGPVVVTGAAGGVGSVAVALLAKLGYTVAASTDCGPQEADYLKGLGASEIIERKELTGPVRPLGKERFAGGIDSVGSTTLANVLSMTRYGGAVAACGLAGGMDLPTSVAPFIPARRFAPWHRVRHVSAAVAPKGLAASGDGSRQVQDRGHGERNRLGRRHCGGPPHRRGPGPWQDRGKNRVTISTLGCQF